MPRIFIAINLPENIKRKLKEYQDKIEELFTPYRNEVSGSGPARWTGRDNLHITLIFLGYVSEQEIPEICKIVREAAARNSVFSVNLNEICYAPPKKMPPRPPKFPEIVAEKKEWEQKFGWPRMIWAVGEKSEQLGRLQRDLEDSLSPGEAPPASGTKKGIVSESRPYAPHITLARIRQWEFRRIEPEERPEIKEETSLNFEVSSIEVMESRLKRGGPKYTILESCGLQN